MHALITSYLLLSKECILPGIGNLKIIHTPASVDYANNLLLPSSDDIIFTPGSHKNSTGLNKYIAAKKQISESEAEDQLNNFCNEWEKKINDGEALHLETIGSIRKNAEGELSLVKEEGLHFFKPIQVTSTYQKIEEPQSVEKENRPVLTETYPPVEEHVIERSYWGIWALILLAIGFVVLFYHFKDRKLSSSGIGNQHHNIIDSATATYKTSK